MPRLNKGITKQIDKKLPSGKTKKIWQARYRYTDANGKRRERLKEVLNKTDGDIWLKQIAKEHEAKKQSFGNKEIRFLDFTNTIEAVLFNRKSVKPVQSQLKFLREFFGHCKLSEIGIEDLQAYRDKRRAEPIQFKNSERQRSDATIAKELSLMQKICRIAIERRLLTLSPFALKSEPLAKAKSVERIAMLSDEQETRILDACMRVKSRANLKPVIITAIESSMRRGEISKLKWRDVDFESEVIRVRKETVKIDEAKTIPMTLRLKETLENHKPTSAKADDFVFADIGDFKKAYATVCKYAGIENFTFHDLRHVAISRMVA